MLAAVLGARGIVLSVVDEDPAFRELAFLFGLAYFQVV